MFISHSKIYYRIERALRTRKAVETLKIEKIYYRIERSVRAFALSSSVAVKIYYRIERRLPRDGGYGVEEEEDLL